MNTLARLLNDFNAEAWSARRITQEAEKKGVKVANTSISKYLRAVPEKPSERVLEAFSVALNIPMVKLREAAELPHGELEPFRLPKEADRLNQRQRDAILHLVSVFLNER